MTQICIIWAHGDFGCLYLGWDAGALIGVWFLDGVVLAGYFLVRGGCAGWAMKMLSWFGVKGVGRIEV